jgi:hypothetical protein
MQSCTRRLARFSFAKPCNRYSNDKETIRARAARDPKFRKELLREGVECMLTGDTATAKTILRDYINATVGFAEVAEATHIPSRV